MKNRISSISAIAMLLTGVLLTACQRDSDVVPSIQTPIQLNTEIGVEEGNTRASSQSYLTNVGTNFSGGQQVALFICESNGTSDIAVTEENYAKLTYKGQQIATTTVTDGDNHTLTFDDGNTRYWPDTNNRLSFYAWYPASAFAGQTVNGSPVISVTNNQSDNAIYAAKDLMTARLIHRERSTTTQTLNFTHALSKIIVVLKSTNSSISDDLMNNASVKLVQGDATTAILLDAVVNIKDGTATAKSDGTNTNEMTIGTGKNTFAVLPTAQSLINKKISITMNGKEQSYTITSVDNLTAGRQYTFTIDLTSARQDFAGTLTVSVNPWGTPEEGQDLTDQKLTI